MKLTVPLLAVAILALGPLTSANAQSSPARHAPATSKSATSPAKSKSSTSPCIQVATVDDSYVAARPPRSPAASAAPVADDVYHVHFTHAASGKATQLADNLKQPNPLDPMPGHSLVLRHRAGDAWDYVVIAHMGPKATVEAVRPAPPRACAT